MFRSYFWQHHFLATFNRTLKNFGNTNLKILICIHGLALLVAIENLLQLAIIISAIAPICPLSVCPSVGPSDCLSVCPSLFHLSLHHYPLLLTYQLTLGCGRPVEVFSKAGSSRPARLWANSRSSSLYSLVDRGPKGSSGSLISRWADSSEPSTLGAIGKRQEQKIIL